ncbi:RNA pseudouridylate synthase domain-containing protein 2-like isoform X1 [Orbicella faveolata]|uniref:RNA pseudouridylate synthase domain-containing protein 2-like isoform X1 n=1 Tax=Orbicella faveolata TaxID=48498 RepID=UPI0009E558DA|nr:RNA pseudouridylate synthase domain-containing protein 2-like isoform X1 [Orbicella faveolata]
MLFAFLVLFQKVPKVKNIKNPGFDNELLKETTCYLRNGLRCVHPYYFTFTTYCKGRWVGRSLIDVFKEEFQSETQEYYEKAITAGKITVNGDVASCKTILKDNDIICNKVHRHEPPVVGNPLEIIELTDELVVLNKPSSIPVHPCGRYRHNTIVFLLGKEHGLTNLFTIHRIDRLTSGILMFARILSKAQELESQVRNRQIEKEYVCKVQGEFPSEEVLCEEPIVVVSHKIGVCRVSRDGKPCKTLFKKISYDGNSSIVKCVPHTGRMHQIRVHLQWLGYPIINDPIYNHESWGPLRGKHGVSDQLVYKVISELAKSSTITTINSTNCNDAERQKEQYSQTSTCDLIDQAGSSEFEETNSSNKDESVEQQSCVVQVMNSRDNGDCLNQDSQSCTDTTEQYYDKDCSECQIIRRDPTRSELIMCLHAVSYKGPDWEFKTGLPSWAEEEKETSSPLITEK